MNAGQDSAEAQQHRRRAPVLGRSNVKERGVKKLEICRRFGIPEVWLRRRSRLEIFGLGASGNYEPLRTRRLLPGLDIGLLESCMAIRSWRQARQKFRSGLAKGK